MFTYIIRRLLQGLGVILAVTFVCFVIFRYSGDPVPNLAGIYATVEERELIRKAFHLDEPFYTQYLLFLADAVQGDFGRSYVSRSPVLVLILERLPATVELATTAMAISFVLGVGLGIVVSLRPQAKRNRLVMAGSLFGISIPTFLIGIALIMLFSVKLGILPPFGRGDTMTIGFWETGFLTWSGISHLILPATTLGLYQLAVLLRLTRAGMREVLMEDYIKTAWSKGLPSRKVILKHALKNVLIPVVTITGLAFGELIAFSIVTETIFQWPGMGNLFLTSVYESDQPVIVTYIMLAALIILVLNIVVDIIYVYLNPKIAYE